MCAALAKTKSTQKEDWVIIIHEVPGKLILYASSISSGFNILNMQVIMLIFELLKECVIINLLALNLAMQSFY